MNETEFANVIKEFYFFGDDRQYVNQSLNETTKHLLKSEKHLLTLSHILERKKLLESK
jgi:hypothetical protein